MITLLDFTAQWCGPCRTMKPILKSLAAEYRIELVEIDVDREPDATARYDVRAMPTIVVLRDGREVGRVVGARPRAFVAGMLDRARAGDTAIACP